MTRAESKRQKDMSRQEKYEQERELQNAILQNYSYWDPLNGDKVFSTKPCAHDKNGNEISFKDIVESKIKAQFGFVYASVFDHESGEVLNRPILKLPSIIRKISLGGGE